ncbi:hypothetical protein CHS0354_028234 [Potamilus streckersoni]|uniref:Uncharacterized protein n=1 Tax=Potamilus streckersoni TaxID=2493646 RepID=A0AAE0VJW8_9BIVA|nr:hypothetical protein CHS0354_028234 [Potamilus streckersoni]
MKRCDGAMKRCYGGDGAMKRCDGAMAEMEGSGRVLGCRAMSRRLISRHGISIGRDAVLRLRVLDPEGVDTRTRHCLTKRVYFNKGPNYLVHVDGYDKLKRYGFGIHGALCG